MTSVRPIVFALFGGVVLLCALPAAAAERQRSPLPRPLVPAMKQLRELAAIAPGQGQLANPQRRTYGRALNHSMKVLRPHEAAILNEVLGHAALNVQGRGEPIMILSAPGLAAKVDLAQGVITAQRTPLPPLEFRSAITARVVTGNVVGMQIGGLPKGNRPTTFKSEMVVDTVGPGATVTGLVIGDL